MTATEPKVDKTGRYTVAQTCEVLDISRETLRKRTKEGKIRCTVSRNDNKKRYPGIEIIRFWRT